ncbi:hypothetical protein JTB14_032450 [Gonioctena quinquepunctata]|nr:hypothetical protein JTB14_032450 [Gonioctena quinquepunctata]
MVSGRCRGTIHEKLIRASWTSATLQEALAAIENGRAVREVSRSFVIPRATLQDRRRNGKVAKGQLGRRPVFSREQESELSEQIINLSKLFFGITAAEINQAKRLHFCQIKLSEKIGLRMREDQQVVTG